MSHKGLNGSGDFVYLTSKASAEEILFFPDSTNFYTQSFAITEVASGIEFPDVKSAKNWYYSEEYQSIVHGRKNNAVGYLLIAEGVD